MKITKIITLASTSVHLRFVALERSLRATGCTLPLWVIPFDDSRFPLPDGSVWWENQELLSWLKSERAHPTMFKYQCLLTSEYQFVDSDVCFLKEPARELEPYQGFVVCCGHWRDTDHALSTESHRYFLERSTNWQRNIFNAGQFACDQALYTFESLKAKCLDSRFIGTCLRFPHHDQPGLNVLVSESNVPYTNLTLPPYNLESSWVGDYKANYEELWRDPAKKPYLLHWAGHRALKRSALDGIFLSFLNDTEKAEWRMKMEHAQLRNCHEHFTIRFWLHKVRLILRKMKKALLDE